MWPGVSMASSDRSFSAMAWPGQELILGMARDPALGPLIVAGSLASALLGGLEGAVAGAALTGTLGWLTTLGISKLLHDMIDLGDEMERIRRAMSLIVRFERESSSGSVTGSMNCSAFTSSTRCRIQGDTPGDGPDQIRMCRS